MNGRKAFRVLYKKLLTLYPQEFKKQLGESMEQTFNDLYNEEQQTQNGVLNFVLWTFAETTLEITKEHVLRIAQGGTMKSINILDSKLAALVAFLFTLPFMILNTIAGNQIEPFYTIFEVNTGGGFWDHPVGHISLIAALLLLPVGAVIAIRPMFHMGADGTRKFHLVNITLAVIMIAFFFLISGALISEIYRCNVLQIPNCD